MVERVPQGARYCGNCGAAVSDMNAANEAVTAERPVVLAQVGPGRELRAGRRRNAMMLVVLAAVALAAVAVAVSFTGRVRGASSSSAAGAAGQRSFSPAEVPVASGLWVNSQRLWDELSPAQKADLVGRLDKLTPAFDATARAFRPEGGLRVRLVPPAKPGLSLHRAGVPPSGAEPELAAVTVDDGSGADFPSAANELWSGGGSVSTDQPYVTDTGSIFRSVADVLSLCAGWGTGVAGPVTG